MEQRYMQRAIELAQRGLGRTNPNPLVGAVIVKDERVIAEGYHQQCGGAHAERNALAACTENPKGAQLYVTLEPCCHHGKTPPCTEAIIEAGISQVIIGSRDPNPLVAGKGVAALQQQGITVIRDYMRAECDRLNPVFFHYIAHKTPYVALKYAMTADGKIATRTGQSKWITDEPAREHVQRLRHQYMAIMVGIGTVLADNPRLTCRMEEGRNPTRIICDSRLRIPLSSILCQTAKEIPTIVATCGENGEDCASKSSTQQSINREKMEQLMELGVQIVQVPSQSGRVDLRSLMNRLGARGIDGILLEGGSGLAASALEEKIVNRIYAYVAPKIFGGRDAKSPIGGVGVALPQEAYQLQLDGFQQVGQDLVLEYEVK